MTHYNLIVIGFGKAGKTLAKYASSQGLSLIHISEPTRQSDESRMPSSA